MTKLNRSVERSMKIIEAVSDNGVCSLALLADQTDLPKSTVLRICSTLISQRWLSQNRSDKRYKIGPRFPRSNPVSDLVDAIVEAGKQEIVELSHATGLAVDLAVSIGNGRIEIVDTTRQFAQHGIYPDTIGYRPSPFRSGLGSAFLAALEPNELAACSEALLANTWGRDRKAALSLPTKIIDVRRRGYAVREEGYWGRAVDYGGIPRAISVAIRAENRAIGAMSLVWLAERQSMDSVAEKHLGQLTRAAQAVGEQFSSNARATIHSR